MARGFLHVQFKGFDANGNLIQELFLFTQESALQPPYLATRPERDGQQDQSIHQASAWKIRQPSEPRPAFGLDSGTDHGVV